MKEVLQKFILYLTAFFLCLLPSLILGESSKCIQGDCVKGFGIAIFPDGSKNVGLWRMMWPAIASDRC
jgi:hypothetical protein